MCPKHYILEKKNQQKMMPAVIKRLNVIQPHLNWKSFQIIQRQKLPELNLGK